MAVAIAVVIAEAVAGAVVSCSCSWRCLAVEVLDDILVWSQAKFPASESDDAAPGLGDLDQHLLGFVLRLLQVGGFGGLSGLADDASPAWGILTSASSGLTGGAKILMAVLSTEITVISWLVTPPLAWGIFTSTSLGLVCCCSLVEYLVPPAWRS